MTVSSHQGTPERQNSPKMKTMVPMRGMRLGPAGSLACSDPFRPPGAVRFVGHGVVWDVMVRVRLDTNISMLDVYSRALRPALSIRQAAKATENSRTTPTMAAS